MQAVEKLSGQFSKSDDFLKALRECEDTKNFEPDDIAKKVVEKYTQVPKVWDELLPKLKQKYKLAVLNNGMSITLSYFKKAYPFQDFFDVFVNSSQENLEKPDARSYLFVCKKLVVKPWECIFIDDMLCNVEGAKALGMVGIVWQDYSTLIRDLKNIFEK